MADRILGIHYTWWRGDDLPALAPLPGLRIARADDPRLLAPHHQLDVEALRERMQAGHQLYVAFCDATLVAYGWSATKTVGIAEEGVEWPMPPTERGLWDFATLEAWRGRGIYPRLLQAILRIDTQAQRFWIGHTVENTPSRRGIEKAGFRFIGYTVRAPNGQFKMVSRSERALADPMGRAIGFVDI